MAVTQGSTVLVWNIQGINLATAGRSGIGICIPAIVRNIYNDAVTIDCVAFLPNTSEGRALFGVTQTSLAATTTTTAYTIL